MMFCDVFFQMDQTHACPYGSLPILPVRAHSPGSALVHQALPARNPANDCHLFWGIEIGPFWEEALEEQCLQPVIEGCFVGNRREDFLHIFEPRGRHVLHTKAAETYCVIFD